MDTGVVIVGASVAGVGAANELRRLGYTDAITVIDSQSHLPYDRPPLSKALLTGAADLEAIAFHDRTHYDDLGLTLRLGRRAVDLDATIRRVLLENGEEILGEAVIVASGARARPFPVGPDSGPVWTIRDVEDAQRLAPQFGAGRRLAVIGGGFIGAEVAASARHRGCDVTVVEVTPLPFAALLGTEVAEILAGLHRAAGTRLLSGVAVERVEATAVGQVLHLQNGATVDADVVVAGLGATPNVEWLAGSAIVDNGVVPCDQFGRTRASGVWAAGDVTTWFNPGLGAAHRHEHWTSAREQARIVAHDILGIEGPRWEDVVPYVWSDQYGSRIQVLGRPAGADSITLIEHNQTKPSFVALYGRRGRLCAVAGCNAAAKVMRYRPKLLDGGVPLD